MSKKIAEELERLGLLHKGLKFDEKKCAKIPEEGDALPYILPDPRYMYGVGTSKLTEEMARSMDSGILPRLSVETSKPDTVKRIAAILFGVTYEEVTEEMRKSTKPVAYTYLYSDLHTKMNPEDWAKTYKESL